MKIVLATQNQNKIREIKNALPNYEIIGIDELNIHEELPENQNTLEGNALEKAQYVFKNFQIPCFADDSGLEIVALQNEPGVFSARYAGPQRSDEDNMNLALSKLAEKPNREAQFRTVIAYVAPSVVKTFEGVVQGKITHEKRGENGFGYDPIFIPNGFSKTFAEMTLEEKGQISHRKKAVEKFIQWMEKH